MIAQTTRHGDIFDRVESWVFDLDNTLYPASSHIFDQANQRMTVYISEYFDIAPDAAHARQKDLFRRYGTSLRGLMVEYQLDPAPYLEFVHKIDLSRLSPDPGLSERLALLPGRKLIFTNATRRHAERVIERLGITEHFDDIFDIVSADFVPKPDRSAYAVMLDRHGVDPSRACMIDDIQWNLEPAKALGMVTVWLRHYMEMGIPSAEAAPDYIDCAIDHLVPWLDDVIARRREQAPRHWTREEPLP